MTPTPTLVGMPKNPMLNILKHCDFMSIICLRKVSSSLRAFIEENKPEIKLTELHIIIFDGRIILEQIHDNGFNYIVYAKHRFGCNVYEKGMEKPAKLICCENYYDIFIQDFEILLKFQKQSLKILKVVVEGDQDSKLMTRLTQFLEKPETSVKVQDLQLFTEKEVLASPILKTVDHKSIKKIELLHKETNEFLTDLVETESWKSADQLFLFDITSAKMAHCTHFKQVYATCQEIPNALEYTEILLKSPNVLFLGIVTDKEQSYAELGRPFNGISFRSGGFIWRKWHFRNPNYPNRVLEVYNEGSKLMFYYKTEEQIKADVETDKANYFELLPV